MDQYYIDVEGLLFHNRHLNELKEIIKGSDIENDIQEHIIECFTTNNSEVLGMGRIVLKDTSLLYYDILELIHCINENSTPDLKANVLYTLVVNTISHVSEKDCKNTYNTLFNIMDTEHINYKNRFRYD